jgi:hypothetical protein
MSSWDQASRGEKLGLVWRNRKKISQIINDYLYLPFFLLIILWIRAAWDEPWVDWSGIQSREDLGLFKNEECRRRAEVLLRKRHLRWIREVEELQREGGTKQQY